jgi:hypothetical protein
MGKHKGRYDWLGTNQRPRPAEEREVGEGERGAAREGAAESAGSARTDARTGAEAPAGGNAGGNAFGDAVGDAGTRELARSLAGDGQTGRRRRRRKRDPSALRNDPGRKVVGAYVRKDIKREVDRALMDERIAPGGSGSFSLLVDGLLERWLEEKWYPLGEGGVPVRREGTDAPEA